MNDIRNPDIEKIGGAESVRRLVDRFYDVMETLPAASHIRKLHPEDTSGSRQKLYEFLAGWLGGPQLYVMKYGHPRLRARHLPFTIGERERDQWLLCMRMALDEVIEDDAMREHLYSGLMKVADHMRNT